MTKIKLPLLIPLLLLLAACSSNPFATANNTETRGDALYGSYVIAKEQGAELLKNDGIPDTAKRPLAELMVASKAVADPGQDLLIEYSAVKAQVAQGTTPQERLAIVEREINAWILKATPLIQDLIKTVGGLLK